MTQQIVRIDGSNKGYDATEPFPARPLCSSVGAGWRDVQLHVHETGTVSDWAQIELTGQPVISVLMSGAVCVYRKHGKRELAHHLQPGYCEVLPVGLAMKNRWTGCYINAHLHIASEALRRACTETFDADPDRMQLINRFPVTDDFLFHGIASALMRELSGAGDNGLLYVETLSQTLLMHLLRHHTSLTQLDVRVCQHLPENALQRVRDYVGDNLACNISLAEMAAQVGLSPCHLTRLFKRETGQALHQFVIQQRVERARQMVLGGRVPLKDIALQVGFADQSHLTRHFRRVLGVTPHELRKNVPRLDKIMQDS